MLSSLSRFIAPLLLCLPASSQGDPPADPCADAVTCLANISATGNGALPADTALYVNNTTTANGSGWWTGEACRTCTNCRGAYTINWDGDGTHCAEQHPCGSIGSGWGNLTLGLWAPCNDCGTEQFELGPCQPNWDPSQCPPTPPLASVAYAVVVQLNCNSCSE